MAIEVNMMVDLQNKMADVAFEREMERLANPYYIMDTDKGEVDPSNIDDEEGHEGKVPIIGEDGKTYWADAAQFAEGTVNDFLADASGAKNTAEYITTSRQDVADAFSMVSTVTTVMPLVSVPTGLAAVYFDGSGGNAISAGAAVLAPGVKTIYKPLGQTIGNLGNAAGISGLIDLMRN